MAFSLPEVDLKLSQNSLLQQAVFKGCGNRKAVQMDTC